MIDQISEQPEEEAEVEQERPALVINVHSWATPIVGIIMLVIGLLGGYLARPLIAERAADPAPVAAAPAPAEGSQPSANQPSPTDDAETAATRQEVMDYVVGMTNHFKGDPDAPVTLIEFSDFQ